MEIGQTSDLQIVPYSTSWVSDFQLLAKSIRRIVGDTAIRIDHIGSTAVPELCAKNKIDIQITIDSDDAFAEIEARLSTGGFSRALHITSDHVPVGRKPDSLQWQKQLYRAPGGMRPMNLHVRVYGRENQRYPILFRDFLRSNRASAQHYGGLKKVLVSHVDDIEVYCDIKDPVCDLIMVHAEQWASQNAWKQPPSDA